MPGNKTKFIIFAHQSFVVKELAKLETSNPPPCELRVILGVLLILYMVG